jgi:hypothetical protein
MSKRTPRERLEHFVRTVDVLERDHDLATLGTKLTVHFDAASGWSQTLEEPERHRLNSLILALRRYTLVREDTCLPTVFGDCRTFIQDAKALAAIESAADAYAKVPRPGGLQLVIDGEDIPPDAAADLFLYGDLFHADLDKADRLQSLDPMALTLVRQQFLAYMFTVAELATWTASVVRHERDRGRLGPEPEPDKPQVSGPG